MKWTALLLGVATLAWSGHFFIGLADALEPFGGIPWSWSFVRLNLFHFALPVMGLVLLAAALAMFVREGP